MHSEPSISSAQVSQQLAGQYVDVPEERPEWLRARSEDGYEGWMHRGFLTAVPPSFGRQSDHILRMSLGCVARHPAGGRRALPLRAMLAPDEVVKSGEVVEITRLATRFPAEPVAIGRTAQEFFEGTSYQWGGVTPWGADCSGLVQSVFALHGIALPRDAWQQAAAGAPGDNDLLAARAGDLLFFSDRDDRKSTHVGIALGARHMVHLALGRGGYAVERLDAAGDAYVEGLRARFVHARRLL